MKKQPVLAGLMGSAVLLAACGGGGGESPATSSTADSALQAASTTPATTATFSCPPDYKKLSINSSMIANTNINLVTDDGIATLTIKTPAEGVARDLAVCLGKPDPAPAGVTADYIYEVKSSGDLHSMASSTLTLNFTTSVKPTPSPQDLAIELADVSGGTVVYRSLVQRSLFAVPPNYSLAANAQDAGLYVVRLTK